MGLHPEIEAGDVVDGGQCRASRVEAITLIGRDHGAILLPEVGHAAIDRGGHIGPLVVLDVLKHPAIGELNDCPDSDPSGQIIHSARINWPGVANSFKISCRWH